MRSRTHLTSAITDLFVVLTLCAVPVFPQAGDRPAPHRQQKQWLTRLHEELPLLGHRNWIAVVDSAYPWQTNPGVETVETNDDQLDVVREVLDRVEKSGHVRPVV